MVRRSGKDVTIEVTVELGRTLMEMEETIQEATNAVGCRATEEALKRFDTDGSPMRVGEMKLTARARDAKDSCGAASQFWARRPPWPAGQSHQFAGIFEEPDDDFGDGEPGDSKSNLAK